MAPPLSDLVADATLPLKKSDRASSVECYMSRGRRFVSIIGAISARPIAP
jgi:hypothetical protein